ncbi:MAG: OmpA family protein [Planctomycetota bacterium]
MRSKLTVLTIILGMVFVAMSTTNVLAAEVVVKEKPVERMILVKEFVKTADNFVILYDASGSMARLYRDTNKKKIDIAEEMLEERNQLLPDLAYYAGLYLYTPFRTYYDMKAYNKSEFAKALDSLPTVEMSRGLRAQPTPLTEGLVKLDSILSGISGRTVVFVFSDGEYTPTTSLRPRINPVQAAKQIASKHDVCFFLISSAETTKGHKLLRDIASLSECSKVVPFDTVYGRPEYIGGALYVVREKKVTEIEMETKVIGMRIDNILFDFDRSTIRPEFSDKLDALGRFMQGHTEAYVTLEGYTDSIGTEEYNMGLSRRRAESVRDYLRNSFNIDQDRIVTQWYGEANPVAGNDTAEGRGQNRRVVFHVGGLE